MGKALPPHTERYLLSKGGFKKLEMWYFSTALLKVRTHQLALTQVVY